MDHEAQKMSKNVQLAFYYLDYCKCNSKRYFRNHIETTSCKYCSKSNLMARVHIRNERATWNDKDMNANSRESRDDKFFSEQNM